MWTKFDLVESTTVAEILSIIDDALCHAFEFKVENHEIYFRELDGTM